MPARAAGLCPFSDRLPSWRLTCDRLFSNCLCFPFKRRPILFSSWTEPGSAWSLLSVTLPLNVVVSLPIIFTPQHPLYPCPITYMTTKASTAAYLTLMTDDSDTPFPPSSPLFFVSLFWRFQATESVRARDRQGQARHARLIFFFWLFFFAISALFDLSWTLSLLVALLAFF